MKNTHSTRRFISKLIIFIIAGTPLFVIYSFFIIPARNTELHKRGFRILSRIEKNFQEKKTHYQYNIDSIYSKLYSEDSTFSKRLNSVLVQPIERGNNYKNLITTKGKIKYKEGNRSFEVDFNNSSEKNTKGPRLKFNEKTSKWEIRFYGEVNDSTCQNTHPLKSRTKVIEYKYDFETFVEPLLNYRDDFFEDFIIYSDSALIYQTKSLSFGHNILGDTSFLKTAILTGQIIKPTLSGEKYIAFVSPFSKTDGLNLTICGIVPKQKFSHGGMLINNHEEALMIMFLMLLFFSMPMIKIFTIARFERFDKKDVFSMILSLVMICLIVTTYSFTNIGRKGMGIWNDENVKTLNNTIKKRFREEHRKRIDDLTSVVTLFQKDDIFQKWFGSSLGKKIFSQQENEPEQFMSMHTENLFIIDAIGDLKAIWQRQPDTIPQINLSERNYFKVIMAPNKAAYYDSSAQKYFFETQFNYQKNNYSVVFSKVIQQQNCPDKYILAMEGRFYSLMNTAIPNEYGFCVIDEHGMVLFHSEETRNRKENFIEESNNNQILKNAISNQSSTALNLSFYGGNYYAYIQPLNKNLPLYLITFKDLQYDHDSSLDIIIYTLIICTFILFIQLLITGLHYLIFSKTSLLHGDRWSFNFLDDNDFNKEIALHLLSFLIPLSLYFLIISFQLYGTDLLYTTFIMPAWIPVYIGLVLEKKHKETFMERKIPIPFEKKILKKYAALKWIALTVLFSINIFQLYFFSSISLIFGFLIPFIPFLYNLLANIGKLKEIGNKFKLILIVLLLIIVLIFYHTTKTDRLIFIYTLCILSLASLLYYIILRTSKAYSYIKKLQRIKSISTLYSLVILLIILNISIIPTFNSARESLVHEYNITNKRRDIELAEKYFQRKTNFKLKSLEQDPSLDSKGVYLPGYVCNPTNTSSIVCSPDHHKQEESDTKSGKSTKFHESQFYKLILNLVHISQEYDFKKRLQSDTLNTESFYKWRLKDNSIQFIYDRQFFNSDARNNLLMLVNHPFPPFNIGIAYREILLNIFILVLFYISVFFIIRKLHIKIKLLNYFQSSNFPTDDLENQLKNICREKRKTILLSIPGSYEETNVVNMIKEILSKQYPKIKINLTHNNKFNAFICPLHPICIVFNYRFLPENLFKKDKDQEQFINILKDENYTIIYLTYQYPFTDLNNFIINPRGAKTNIPDDIPQSNIKFYSTLVEIFGNYKKIIISTPKAQPTWPDFKILKLNSTQFPYLCHTLTKELESLNFQPGIKESIENKVNQYIYECFIKIEKGKKRIQPRKETLVPSGVNINFPEVNEEHLFHYFPNINEELILEIQSISYNHYISIWRSLTSPEKLVLFEIASDMIINHRNLDILILLKDKGVIQYCDEQKFLMVFNRSFKNFILSEVTSEEIDMIETDLKIKHTWDNTKSALIIFFLIVGIFMLITQPEVTNRIVGFLISFISIIPLIYELFQKGMIQKK